MDDRRAELKFEAWVVREMGPDDDYVGWDSGIPAITQDGVLHSLEDEWALWQAALKVGAEMGRDVCAGEVWSVHGASKAWGRIKSLAPAQLLGGQDDNP